MEGQPNVIRVSVIEKMFKRLEDRLLNKIQEILEKKIEELLINKSKQNANK